jgi:hypothetical protein
MDPGVPGAESEDSMHAPLARVLTDRVNRSGSRPNGATAAESTLLARDLPARGDIGGLRDASG